MEKLKINAVQPVIHSVTTLVKEPKKETSLFSLGLTLKHALDFYNDAVAQYEEITTDLENIKTKYLTQTENCRSQMCDGCQHLKQVISKKDLIIQLVASTLTRLNETKNFKILDDVFKILCDDTLTLTPPKDSPKHVYGQKDVMEIKKEDKLIGLSTTLTKAPDLGHTTPKKDVPFMSSGHKKDESLSEIEGTPTGRMSPIIPSKVLKSRSNQESPGLKKKRGSRNWPTSESKIMKLTSTPSSGKNGGRLRQARIQLVSAKESTVVDLTCSPNFAKLREEDNTPISNMKTIKPEPFDFDETILPSPTSGPAETVIPGKYNRSFYSPSKFKKPPDVASKIMTENEDSSPNKLNCKEDRDISDMENSINLFKFHHRNKNVSSKLQLKRREEPSKTTSAVKTEPPPTENIENCPTSVDITQIDSPILNNFKLPLSPKKNSMSFTERMNGVTECDTNVSLSILQRIENKKITNGPSKSPEKKPLCENVNITNVQTQPETEVSMSLLQRDAKFNVEHADKETDVRKKLPELVEPVYKEPTVRKKAEKRALPGWSCDECKNFYSELHKDNPDMLLKLMEECSKHRGRSNPARPPTPPGFWNPRWDVPEDTHAFNQRNDAV